MSNGESKTGRTLMGADGTRREFLGRSGVTVAGLAGASLLAACGGTSQPQTKAGGAPSRGGTLRLGVLGGGSSDTLDGNNGLVPPDYARLAQLYNRLGSLDQNGAIVIGQDLAESIEASNHNTVYDIRLKPDIFFHNGKPLVPADVIFTFTRSIKNGYDSAGGLSAIDLNGFQILDSRTLRCHLTAPSKAVMYALCDRVAIVPVGFNPKQPAGTGPFKYSSFTPGQQSTFVRNDHYFKPGVPYLDSIVIIDYPDPTSRLNALLGHELDAIDGIDPVQLPTITGAGFHSHIQRTALNLMTYMRVDKAPFTDNRVRTAMKLIMNRPQIINVANGERAELGNDIWAKFYPDYDNAIPQRDQDLEMARSLLKSAGQGDMAVTLVTAPAFTGMVETAQVIAANAQQAGVRININNTTSAVLFGPTWLSWTFGMDYWYGKEWLYQLNKALVKGAVQNETHYSNPAFQKLYDEANYTESATLSTELVGEMQKMIYDNGGTLIPSFLDVVDASAPNLQGVLPAALAGYSFGDYDFERAYFS